MKFINTCLRKANTSKLISQGLLNRIFQDLGVTRSHTDYEKFIILGRARTGSNFLRMMLSSHNQVIVFGELFRESDAIEFAYPGYYISKRMLTLYQEYPEKFLRKYIFRRYPPSIRAVGFKYFYHHSQRGNNPHIWKQLQGMKDLKIIHLKRVNYLEMHLSTKVALMSKQWINTTGELKRHEPISLDYEECLRAFESTRHWEYQFDRYFDNHQKIDVIYEELARDYVKEMYRVQKFLGLDYKNLKPQTYKQSKQSLAESILNYDELKERFLGSPWEQYFEDQSL